MFNAVMNFGLGADIEALRDTVRRFAAAEIAPRAATWSAVSSSARRSASTRERSASSPRQASTTYELRTAGSVSSRAARAMRDYIATGAAVITNAITP